MTDNSPPIALSIPQAVAASARSRTDLYRALRTGELRAKKRGRATLILAGELQRWLEALPDYAPRKAA